MPPWIIPELAPEAPDATSFFSNIRVLRPRIAASRAIPVPFTPPPMMITSNSAGLVIFCCSLHPPREPASSVHLPLGRLRPGGLDVKLLQLSLVHFRRRSGHRVRALLGLGEGNHVPQRFATGEKHRQAVHPNRDPAVGRSAVLESIEQEAELQSRFLFADSHRLEDLGLHFRIVDA